MSLSIFLQQHFYLFVIFITLVGACVGSFINVVIYRLPIMLQRQWDKQTTTEPFNLAVPRSRCPACNNLIVWWQNIPVISYLFLRGRCFYCQHKISSRYPLIELLCALLALGVSWHFGVSWTTLFTLAFCFALVALFFIDLQHQLLPDAITLPMLWLGLIANLMATYTSLHDAVIGAVAGYLSLWFFMQAYKLFTGKEGMGYGDFKLFALIGAWLGWQVLPFVIILASLLGVVIGGGYLVLTRQQKSVPIAFGPYLAISALVALFFQSEITHWLWLYIA